MYMRHIGTVLWNHKLKTAALIVFALYALQLIFFSLPRANAAATIVVLTSGTSYTIPSDWNSTSNTIEAIGGGAGGMQSGSSPNGGGGGGYSKITNYSGSGSKTIQIGQRSEEHTSELQSQSNL